MKVILKFLQTYEAELFSHLIINEDWRNDAEKSALHPRNKLHFRIYSKRNINRKLLTTKTISTVFMNIFPLIKLVIYVFNVIFCFIFDKNGIQYMASYQIFAFTLKRSSKSQFVT